MLAYLFVVLALAVRFLPHLFNFSPLGAALLFFGAKRPKEEWAPVVCVALFADALLTTQVYHLPLRWDVFASAAYYVIALFLGWLLKEKASALRVGGMTLAGSLAFFLTSNFIAWLALDMYTKDFAGLMHSYFLAIPFFRWTMVGDLVFAAVMFGTPVLAEMIERKRGFVTVRHG